MSRRHGDTIEEEETGNTDTFRNNFIIPATGNESGLFFQSEGKKPANESNQSSESLSANREAERRRREAPNI